MRRNLVFCLMVFGLLAASAQAAEPFVVLVDEEHGLLLIPEGTAVPRGVEFSLAPADVDASRPALMADAAAPRRLVYAYAAPERFEEARRRVAEIEAKFPQPSAEVVLAEGGKAGRTYTDRRPGRIATDIANFDQTYFYYFWDNSYHAVRKIIWNQGDGWVQYTAYGYVYSEAGAWDTKVVVSNNCPTSGYSLWTQSKTCWFYNAAGNCTPTVWTYVTPYTVTATVNSSATLTRYLYPPCDLPCKSNSSSTASVSFP